MSTIFPMVLYSMAASTSSKWGEIAEKTVYSEIWIRPRMRS